MNEEEVLTQLAKYLRRNKGLDFCVRESADQDEDQKFLIKIC